MTTLGEKAEMALRIVEEAPLIAYDTETTGLDWKKHQPVGYVITDPTASIYIPIRHGGGANLLDPNVGPMKSVDDKTKTHKFERDLQKAFAVRRTKGYATVGHNLKFDMHFSANQDIYLGRNCFDTSLTQPMLDEWSKSFSLDGCAKEWNVTAKKGEPLYQHLAALFGGVPDKKIMEHFWRLPGDDEIGVDYATGDGVTTLELHQAQMAAITEQDMGIIHGIESELIWTIFRMERAGVRVDEAVLAETIEKINAQIERAKQLLPPRFNVRSQPQIKKWMEETGHTDWPTTEVGNPSFPEKWLKKHDEGKAIIAVRQLSNLMNSFITPLKDTHMHKGKVHASFHQLAGDEYGTISGRFSCSQPNMQQVPKRNKELGAIFRRLFIPDDGFTLVEADYSQCEPRLFAHYSKEPALVAGYSASPPRDMHAVVAELFAIERDGPAVSAKRMNMGILTGMQANSFSQHMELPLDEAKAMFNQWFEFFPGIKGFQDTATRTFRQRGYVRTILGRRCRLDHARFAYRAVSRIIQGSNADIIKERTLAVDKFVESEYGDDKVNINLTIHDADAWQAEDGICAKATKQMTQMFCEVQGPPYNLRVPFKMDVGMGKDWATATYGGKH